MSDEELRPREVTDPRALRAIAHPLRLRILEVLAFVGPLTATGVADRVGESPANCSWHLRQLARYGFVAEAGGGTGRQRPWRLVIEARRWGEGEESPELARVGDAAVQVLVDQEVRALRDWFAARRQESPEWRDAAFLTQSVGWCTAEELSAISTEVIRLFRPLLARIDDPASRPAGSRPIRLMAWGVPALTEERSPREER